MPKPIDNNALTAKAGLEGNVGGIRLKASASVKVSEGQGGRIFQQVTNNLGRNPNRTRANRQNNNNQANQNQPTDNPNARRGNNQGNGNNGIPPGQAKKNQAQNNTPNAPNQTGNNNQNPRAQNNQENNGTQHASQRGLENGLGHRKADANQQTTQQQPNTQIDLDVDVNTARTQTTPLPGNTNQPTVKTNGNNFPVQPPFGNQVPTRHGTQHQPTVILPPTATNQTNQPLTNLVDRVLSSLFQRNDVYFNNNGNYHPNFQNNNYLGGQTATPQMPREIVNLARNVSNQILIILGSTAPSQTNNKTVQLVVEEVSRQFHAQIETAKEILLQNPDLGAKHFKHLNIDRRMEIVIEHLPPHLPPEFADDMQARQSRDVLCGLLITRGFAAGQEKTAALVNLIACQPPVLPRDVTLAKLRDVGHFVKILIADAAIAKSTANLDLAVQKFVRLLLANNELGVLLATINLAAQTQDRGQLVNRSLALVQIYELINRLLLAGEKAMKLAMAKNAMPEAIPARDLLSKVDKREVSPLGVAREKDENSLNFSKLHGSGAESGLRQFLEFNPAAAFDNSASAFRDSDDAQRAQKEFVSVYGDEIDRWLKSGNHRFVSEIDFEKPIGVVVERSYDDVFTASKVRFVLVRDASVQGWHFLKSFLVT